MAELKQAVSSTPLGRVRRPGGGRKRATVRDPKLQQDLERLVEPVTRGDPQSPLRWTCKSVRNLAAELNRGGHQTNRQTVAELLRGIGYSLQANRKTLEGRQHPDRNAQFEHINERVRQHLLHGQPVISVDTKKKELVGEFKNNGQEWRPKGEPEKVGGLRSRRARLRFPGCERVCIAELEKPTFFQRTATCPLFRGLTKRPHCTECP